MTNTDTSPDAAERQAAVFRAMTPDQRLALAFQMADDAFDLAVDGVRHRHPTYTERQAWLAAVRLRLGDDSFRSAYPDEPLLAP